MLEFVILSCSHTDIRHIKLGRQRPNKHTPMRNKTQGINHQYCGLCRIKFIRWPHIYTPHIGKQNFKYGQNFRHKTGRNAFRTLSGVEKVFPLLKAHNASCGLRRTGKAHKAFRVQHCHFLRNAVQGAYKLMK